MNIQYTDQAPDNGIKCLVYGGSGVGKTPLCASAPAPFIISAEAGLRSIKHLHVPYVEIRSNRELAVLYCS
jgi:hypothetical protein